MHIDTVIPRGLLDEFIAIGQPMRTEGTPNRFDHLLPMTMLQHVLATHELRYPRFRLVRGGIAADSRWYTNQEVIGSSSYDWLVPHRINQLLEEGYLLALNHVHAFAPELRDLVASLEATRPGQANANLYLAKRPGQGLSAHYDTDDLFVMQVRGRKSWKLTLQPQEEVATLLHPGNEEMIPSSWSHEFVLNPGDFLYVPQGWWHTCETMNDGGSFHIACGMTVPRVSEYLYQVLARIVGKHPTQALDHRFRPMMDRATFDRLLHEAGEAACSADSMLAFHNGRLPMQQQPVPDDFRL